MPAGAWEDADGLAVALAWLRGDPDVQAAFPGQPSGVVEAPWPHLRVAAGAGGGLGDLRWISNPEVLLEVYADPQGTISSPAAFRLLMMSLRVLARMPETRVVEPGEAVVTNVAASGAAMATPLESGQLRWSATVALTMHPGLT